MADISWIKLKTTMFDDEKIRLIQSMPEANAILVIWIRLLVLAGKTNDSGLIYIQRNMPYTDEMLATLFNQQVNTVRLALKTLNNFDMIDTNEDGMIAIENWEKHQNIEGLEQVRLKNAERNQRYRERKKLAMESDVSVTSRDATDKELELDKEIDKDIKNKDSRKSRKRVYADDDRYLILAKYLYEKILTNGNAKEPNFQTWADDIRKMVEIDKRSIEEVKAIIDWSQTDSFWQSNILSAKKLREKYDTMIRQSNRPKKQFNNYNPSARKETMPDWTPDKKVDVAAENDKLERELREAGKI